MNEEHIAGNPVFGGFHWALSHEVDPAKREVKARAVGGFESRAVYREGLGCLNLNGTQPPDAPTRAEIEADGPIPVLLPDIAGPEIVAPAQAGLKVALDGAFAEPDGKPVRRTHAVVIIHNGRVVGERYAEGFGIDTPVHGWSATKSVNNALLGILVRQGKLNMEESAPVAAWQTPGDPRRAITLDHLTMALGIYGQTVVVVPSERLVITRFGTTYDLRMAMVDICRLTAGTIAALHVPASGGPPTTPPR